MRVVHAALLVAISASPAFAQRVPAIVIPSRPDVPILMNGVDISWSVVESDFGLDRPLDVMPTVIYRPFGPRPVRPAFVYGEPGYYPSTGQRPGYGRLEVVPPPNRPLPPPAPSYYRNWSSESAPLPPTEYAPYPTPPVYLSVGDGGHRHHHRPHVGPHKSH